MSRRLLPVVSVAAFGTGGILGVLFERFESEKKCSYIVQAPSRSIRLILRLSTSVKLDFLIADLNLY